MSDRERRAPGAPQDPGAHEADVKSLLELAGRRPDIPQEDLATITAAARATWRKQVAEPSVASHRRRWPLALAAMVMAALGAALWWGGVVVNPFTAPPPMVAEAQRIWGRVSVDGGHGLASVLEGQDLPAGSLITTTGRTPGRGGNAKDGNRIALVLQGGTSLRLDHGSRLRLISPTDFQLEAGAVYIDTGSQDRPAVAVHTAFGTVTDIGTQFSVRLPPQAPEGGALEVRVREGEVQVSNGAGNVRDVPSGTELLLAADGSGSSRGIPPFGPEWDWILDAAPRFDVEGMTLAELLVQVSRETGWGIQVEDASLAAATEATVLHGTTGSLRPDRAALVALAGAGFHGEVQDGTLIVRRARNKEM